MRKGEFRLIVVTILILFTINLSFNVSADDKTAVGVLNVGPSKISTRVIPQDDMMRIYLTISDYNSWEDIFKVDVILEYHGMEAAIFSFNQYEDRDSFVKSNTFTEISLENNLLQKEKCTFQHSDDKETVADKCNLEILFVFRVTWFTDLKVVAEDRGGLKTSTSIEYSTEPEKRTTPRFPGGGRGDHPRGGCGQRTDHALGAQRNSRAATSPATAV